ncbi:hypothetical protein [Kribbella catacumbae]|uniref:hypothetical protein n=1 Tax=Kribbella catacumbae TaxID=460086 RepID=UPI000369CAD6|nr:hypothetical protein [Kribbella catacumbae]
MRSRTAGLVLGVAATLGTLVGAVVLPDRGTGAGGNQVATKTPTTTPTGKSLSPTPSSPLSTPDGGPVAAANMLSDADFRKVGLTLTAQPSEVRLELVGCDKKETLDSVALSGPPVQRVWEAGSVVAYEQAIAARDEDEAAEIARRVLRKLEACQEAAAGHWVYGPTHSEQLDPATAASWLGEVSGELNTTGRAPKGEKINGGMAVLRRGTHVGVLTINWCSSAGDEPACIVAGSGAYNQLAALSKAAALRLG